tara:strand:- start:20308 stop:20832 length:525 start_codon:yes stop_codon:yes gene_type:complete
MNRDAQTITNDFDLSDEPTIRFDAVLQPHTSLGPQGFLLLMAVIGVISFTAGVAFIMVGAWPVFGFLGLDVVLVYVAFKFNYRDARRYETVKLTDRKLLIERVGPTGRRQKWSFQTYWLKVDLENPPTPESALMLRSHGKVLEIGSFLTPQEKYDLATALRDELEKLRRNPVTQ